MRKFEKVFFSIVAILAGNVIYAQDILSKMKASQVETKNAAHDGAVIVFGYADIGLGLIMTGWAIMSFRSSRASSEDGSGEDFSWVKFILPKAAVVIVYVIIRIVALNILS